MASAGDKPGRGHYQCIYDHNNQETWENNSFITKCSSAHFK